MYNIFFDKAGQLHEAGVPYALATVVRFEAPSSGKPGDKAIIKADGTIEGWIGGGCTQPVVIKEAQLALKDGNPRLIRIAAVSDIKKNGMVVYPMTCHSGGELDVFIEPVYPKPHMVILGHSVVAQTLCRLARAIHYRVTVLAPEADTPLELDARVIQESWDLSAIKATPHTFVVVATQGEGDEAALREVFKTDWSYMAFVASRKKAGVVLDALREDGLDESKIEAIRVPAGLDIKARLPEEIAVSILAEVIQVKRSLAPDEGRQEDQEVIEAGYLAETLAIDNMSCQHCVSTVEKTLNKIDGVHVGEVLIGSAAISYNPGEVDRGDIVAAIEKRGYEVLAESN